MIPHGRLDGWSSDGASARHAETSAATAARLGAKDAHHSEQAQRIQESRRGWLVMWSVWHRTFTAFSCFAPVPLVVDEPTIEGLLDHMLRAELYYSTSHRQPVVAPA